MISKIILLALKWFMDFKLIDFEVELDSSKAKI